MTTPAAPKQAHAHSELISTTSADATNDQPIESKSAPGWRFPFSFSKAPQGWALGVTDGAIVLVFSLAPLLISALFLVLYPPGENGPFTIRSLVADYFGKGELLFVALSILGSVAAKIWLDPQYRPHWVLPMQLAIVSVFVLGALIASGRTSDRAPEMGALLLFSAVSLTIAMCAYVWLTAKGGDLQPTTVEQNLSQEARDLASEVRKLRGDGE